jgi:signal transduction histidine kinase
MIEKQGGVIKTNSEKGWGTTISFILPQWVEEEFIN